MATSGDPPETSVEEEIKYGELAVIGNGSFGVVFRTNLTDKHGTRMVALKKVLQDRRYKVRAGREGEGVCVCVFGE
jgi:hypothetical protein